MEWPNSARAAVSLSFDDARASQAELGFAVLRDHGIRATFYVTIPPVAERLDAWKSAVSAGHEIGNHTLTHPCSCNFPFARRNPLEDFTLHRMAADIDAADSDIHRLLGVKTTTFAYPCGQKFIGRGEQTQSYVPLIARRYKLGRGFRDEAPNEPDFFDPSQACGVDMDMATLDDLRPLLDVAMERSGWLLLAGHDFGMAVARQVTLVPTIEKLARFCRDEDIWMDTVDAVITHILKHRQDPC